jgi:hypothetical protein
MTKATSPLHPKSVSLNRRRLLGGVAAVAGVSVPAVASAGVSLSPTPAGRRVLELIAEYAALGFCDASDDDPRFIAWQRRWLGAHRAIDKLGQQIIARPIASFADVIDRAILAAWACQPIDGELIGDGDDPGGFKSAMILDVLAVAGIRPSRCNVDMA